MEETAMDSTTHPTRSLPERADLDQLKRQAKDLLRAAQAGEPGAVERLGRRPAPRLADAQFVLAREYGFASWPRLKASIAADGGVRLADRARRHLEPTTFSPASFLDAARRNGWSPGRLPTAMVFAFQPTIAHHLAESDDFEEQPEMAVGNGRYFITVADPAIAVSCMSPGSAYVGQVENQLALGGASQFVILNLAGGLGPDVAAGDLAVIEAAVRDDGISDHYLAPGDVVDADQDLTESLLAAVSALDPTARRHVSWTNPAVFRQTQAEHDHYVAQGVTIVESEIASLLAVCAAHGVAGGAVVVVSANPDVDDEPVDWNTMSNTQRRTLRAIIAALR
jgi:uridine phosphorylase